MEEGEHFAEKVSTGDKVITYKVPSHRHGKLASVKLVVDPETVSIVLHNFNDFEVEGSEKGGYVNATPYNGVLKKNRRCKRRCI